MLLLVKKCQQVLKSFFIDGNKRNFERSNLALISDADLMRQNTNQRFPPELRNLIRTLNKLKTCEYNRGMRDINYLKSLLNNGYVSKKIKSANESKNNLWRLPVLVNSAKVEVDMMKHRCGR